MPRRRMLSTLSVLVLTNLAIMNIDILNNLLLDNNLLLHFFNDFFFNVDRNFHDLLDSILSGILTASN